jgi:predicted Zn-dependent protease
MSEAMVIKPAATCVSTGVSSADPRWQAVASTAYGVTTTVGRELPHSRAQESEADHIGVIYMARAGYDPEAAVQFWERFMAHNNPQGGGTLPFCGRTPRMRCGFVNSRVDADSRLNSGH